MSPIRTPVAALLDARSIDNIPSFLTIVYAGCANVPFDITMPWERLTQLLDLLVPSAILADEKGRAALEGISATVPVVHFEDACATPVDEAILGKTRMNNIIAMDPMSILYLHFQLVCDKLPLSLFAINGTPPLLLLRLPNLHLL